MVKRGLFRCQRQIVVAAVQVRQEPILTFARKITLVCSVSRSFLNRLFLYTAPEADGNEIKKMVYRGRGVGFLLLTCVSYQTGADQNIHRTVQSYWVIDGSRRLDGMIFNPAGAVVRMTDLRFDPIQLVNKAD